MGYKINLPRGRGESGPIDDDDNDNIWGNSMVT